MILPKQVYPLWHTLHARGGILCRFSILQYTHLNSEILFDFFGSVVYHNGVDAETFYLESDNQIIYAGMMELVDMRDLGSRASGVGVRVPMPAP